MQEFHMIRRPVSWLTSAALLIGTVPSMPLRAQPLPMPGQAQGQVQLYAAAQLDSILAPIALYPDVLLTQVLMASAFPFQIVEAARWVQNQANQRLRGEALAQALAPMEWDPSVKSLVPFPGVLAQLNGNLQWLQQLGYAAANQQPDVLDSVQRLRHQAEIAGNLRSSPQYIVRQEERFIYIEPAQPNVIYVPAYNPVVVYGTWAYPAYPPYYLPPPMGYGWGPVVGAGLIFGTAIVVSALLWDLGRPRWRDRHIFVNTTRYNTINVNRAPYRGGDVWRPHEAATYRTGGGLVSPAGVGVGGRPGPMAMPPPPMRGPSGGGLAPGQQPRMQGGAGTAGTGVLQPGGQPRGPGGPGGGSGAAGHSGVAAPGLQPRSPGAPGTAGHSGVAAPGLQPRTPGAPGTAGQSGVAPPGLQQRSPGAPGTAGQSGITPPSHPGPGPVSSGMPRGPQGGGMPGGGQPGHVPGGPSGGGGSPPAPMRMQGGGGGAPAPHVAPPQQHVAPPPQHVAPQGGGGGGGGRQDPRRPQP